MPFTPYHFGPSTFIGLVFRKWLDVPVFVLANVIVDIEVLVIYLFRLGYPTHRYCHTLLIGSVLGLLWGASAYPLRHIFKRLMQILHIPYQTGFLKMLISGILGVWLHVLIDSIYHFDVRIFWPAKAIWWWRTMYHRLNEEQIKTICLFFLLAAVVPYLLAVRSFRSIDMRRGGKLSRQLKFGVIFVGTYGVLTTLMFVDLFCSISGHGEANLSGVGLLLFSVIVLYAPMRIGLISNKFAVDKFYGGLFLTGLLVFGIGLLVGHIITIIVRHKAQNDLRS